MDKSKFKCVVCHQPIGENGAVYINSVGQVEALCENNHDALLPMIDHTEIDESTADGIAKLLFAPKRA